MEWFVIENFDLKNEEEEIKFKKKKDQWENLSDHGMQAVVLWPEFNQEPQCKMFYWFEDNNANLNIDWLASN